MFSFGGWREAKRCWKNSAPSIFRSNYIMSRFLFRLFTHAQVNECTVTVFLYRGQRAFTDHTSLHLNCSLSSSHLSLNRGGPWGTTDDFATSFLHVSLFSTALWDLANSRPVHSLMLLSHLLHCLPCLLSPFTVPCKMVFAKPDERET